MTPEQAQYLDEVEARANRALDTPEWSSDTTQSLVEVERLTALVRAQDEATELMLIDLSSSAWPLTLAELRAFYGLDNLP